jgi:hypothetical protein
MMNILHDAKQEGRFDKRTAVDLMAMCIGLCHQFEEIRLQPPPRNPTEVARFPNTYIRANCRRRKSAARDLAQRDQIQNVF